MNTLLQDIRFGIRMLAKSPGLAAIALITLVLGIGANTAIFSVLHAIVLRPLPFPEPDRLVAVWESTPEDPLERRVVSYLNFADWRDQNEVFDGMSLIRAKDFTLSGRDAPEWVAGARVSSDFFPLLGVEAVLGRTLRPEDDQVGAEAVVVLGDGLWRRRFGADPGIIGQVLTLDRTPHTVVGVLPAGFEFPWDVAGAELWTSAVHESALRSNRNAHGFNAVARLKPNITFEQAQIGMNTIAARIQEQYPDTRGGVLLVPLHEQVVGNIRPTMLILFGAVILVLVIVCVNVANLLSARGADRAQELALRAALGASRPRLIRQLLTESALLALVAGSLGLLLAWWTLDALVTLIPADAPRIGTISLTPGVFCFALLLSVVTGLVFGLAPAFQATSASLPTSLRGGARDGGPRVWHRRLRGILVVSEVGLALVLLTGAGLLLSSFYRLTRVDPGFDPAHMLTFNLAMPSLTGSTVDQRAELCRSVLDRIEAIPGVRSACANVALPLASGSGVDLTFAIAGRPEPTAGPELAAQYGAVSAGYFRGMGISLLQGRAFSELDTRGQPGVMVISECMARRFWPGDNPLGQRVRVGVEFFGIPTDDYEIVGIVSDVRQSIFDEPEPQMYVPYEQQAWPFMSFALRASGDPLSLVEAVRREVATATTEMAPYGFSTFDRYLAEAVSVQRVSTILLGLYGCTALVLAGVGLYGVLAYSVARRTHEMGVRMALGARRIDVVALVLRQGMTLAAVGLVIGLLGAFAGTRVLSRLLFETTPLDPVTFGSVATLLLTVALLACWIPARRATRVDPMVALRCE
jgi:putative ABC transport system permease protein